MSKMIHSLFLAAEAVPYVKVGGLADVAGSLPLALRRLHPRSTGGKGLDVRLILPLYPAIQEETVDLSLMTSFTLDHRGGGIPVQVYQTWYEGMPVYFISGDPIAESDSVYSGDEKMNQRKFSFFSLAVLELLKYMDWRVDILHANDWHTALALYGLKMKYDSLQIGDIKSILTLHNLPYTGGEADDILKDYGLPSVADEDLPAWAESSPLPLGLWAADLIVPVSKTYAKEILTPAFGCGLELFLRKHDEKIVGIINGLDTVSFDPLRDPALAARFNSTNLDKRAENKKYLQNMQELPLDPEIPLIGMVGRIDFQKGYDLVVDAFRKISQIPFQAVLLGSGDANLEQKLKQLASDLPDRVRVLLRYDPTLSRQIYGGADIFVMPSRYEPCGLAQMIAMRYGCVPVVHRTGGLKDTVRHGHTGFHFQEAAIESLSSSLSQTISAFADKERWRKIQLAGMKKDFSWRHSAKQYASLYHTLITQVT